MATNSKRSLLDITQIFQRSFEEHNDALRVSATVNVEGGTSEILISHVDDSIRIGDGTTLTTVTSIGSKSGLDVNVIDELSGTFKVGGLSVSGRITDVTINDSSWTALPVAALNGRNTLSIQNYSGFELKINYAQVGGYVGIRMPNKFERSYNITDNIIIYAKLAPGSGTGVVTVEELA